MKIKKMIAAVTALVLVGGAYNVTAEKSFISSVLAADTEDSVEVVKDGIEYTLSNGEAVVNGVVDASSVLAYYAMISTNQDGGYGEEQKLAADVNHDGLINAVDASSILSYYAYISTTKEKIISMEEFMKK